MKKIILMVILSIFLASASYAGNAATATANGSVMVTFPDAKDTIKAQGYRGYVIPADIKYPTPPVYCGEEVKGSAFQDSHTILKFRKEFTVEELKRMVKGMSRGTKVILTSLVDEIDKKDRPELIRIYTGTAPPSEMLGYITIKATKKDIVSVRILATAALKAREIGGNAIQIVSEGIERTLSTFGWGVGAAYTGANMNAGDTASGVAAGGTGIAGGSATYYDRPWLQMFVLKVKN